VWEVDGATGQRSAAEPVTRVSIDESGDWGPVQVQAGRHYEFAVLRPGSPTHHHYYEPFLRSDHLVRVLESDPLTLAGDRGPRHVSGVILRYKEMWGDQGEQNDVVALNGTNICTEVLCPVSKRVNAAFFADVHSDGQTDLSTPNPVYSALPFVIGVDIFLPAETPPSGKTTLELRSRGGGPARTVNFPNFASLTDVVTVQLNDFEKTDATAACRRSSTVRFRLRRRRGAPNVRAVAYVNGRRVLRRSGRDLRRLTLRRLPRDGTMRVRIVTTRSNGSKLVSTRVWRGCAKSKPRTRVIPRPR
jgi:hypothetical protein